MAIERDLEIETAVNQIERVFQGLSNAEKKRRVARVFTILYDYKRPLLRSTSSGRWRG
jgi:hypothetical protein